jgi:hypothetical protein
MGSFPCRGKGVIVFVTKASRESATSGAVSASRQPLALRIGTLSVRDGPMCQDGACHAEALEPAVELDDAAVAGTKAARHRRLPGELRARDEAANSFEHGLGAAGEHVAGVVAEQRGHERGLDYDLGAGHECRRLGVVSGAKAQDRRRVPEHLRDVREWRDADAAPDDQGARHREVEPVPEGPEDVDAIAGIEPAERLRAGADRVDQEAELARLEVAERHRPRQDVAGRPEHEELPGDAGLDRTGCEPQERVGADRVDPGHAQPRAGHAPVSIRSCSDSAVSARALAIACTAAAAPEIVVMQGTRALSAASRMR